MSEHAGRGWVNEPPLPELDDPQPPPRPDLIQVHGAQLVRIYTIDHPDPRRHKGFTEALFIAWAPLDAGDWAVLAAWLGHWQEDVRTTGRGRHGWLRLTADDLERGRVRAVKPHLYDEEDEWHGHHTESDFSIGVREAAATLPPGMRWRAVRPRQAPPSGPGASPVPPAGSTPSGAV